MAPKKFFQPSISIFYPNEVMLMFPEMFFTPKKYLNFTSLEKARYLLDRLFSVVGWTKFFVLTY